MDCAVTQRAAVQRQDGIQLKCLVHDQNAISQGEGVAHRQAADLRNAGAERNGRRAGDVDEYIVCGIRHDAGVPVRGDIPKPACGIDPNDARGDDPEVNDLVRAVDCVAGSVGDSRIVNQELVVAGR